ncbi:MAG: hypothetical protein CL862_02685 [Cyanobium sp. NAT70]|nr:hypothetical protein [Cyanobium sp. NAT70]|tara:strand:+ start:780 stop:1121 length:342 start_codon:yes stop_codon:yes gene_type:complete
MGVASEFLAFQVGDVVLVEPVPADPVQPNDCDWWIGQIIHVDGGAREPNVPTMFQVWDVDTGAIKWVNADEATRLILKNYEPLETNQFILKSTTIYKHNKRTSKRYIHKRTFN